MSFKPPTSPRNSTSRVSLQSGIAGPKLILYGLLWREIERQRSCGVGFGPGLFDLESFRGGIEPLATLHRRR